MTSEKVIPRMERVGWLTYSFFFVCFIYFSYMEKNGSFVGGLEYFFCFGRHMLLSEKSNI